MLFFSCVSNKERLIKHRNNIKKEYLDNVELLEEFCDARFRKKKTAYYAYSKKNEK